MSAENDHFSKILLFYAWISMTAVNKLDLWQQQFAAILKTTANNKFSLLPIVKRWRVKNNEIISCWPGNLSARLDRNTKNVNEHVIKVRFQEIC